MKAQDLMIGDWVLYNGIANKIALADFGIDKGHTKWRNAIEPIPLTPEILEKNGFISRGSGWYIPNTPRLDMGILSFGIDDGCGTGFSLMPNGDFVFFSKYVHELQHCLNVIGINKDIAL